MTRRIACAAAGAIAVLGLAGPLVAQRHWGVYKEHYGVYTSPRAPREAVLPWQQAAPAAPAAPAARSEASGGRLPWQRPASPMGISPLPESLRPAPVPAAAAATVAAARPALASWSTGPFSARYWGGTGLVAAPYGAGGGYWGHSASSWGGLGVGWTYGPRAGRSFFYSSRAGVMGFSVGRFWFSAAW